MSKFIGVKMVEAVPMTAQTAKSKGYRVSTNHYYTNDNSQDKNFIDYDFNEGYEVTYPDGYKSWCPKDVFEKNNVLIQGLNGKIDIPENVKVESFVQRVIGEYNELNIKFIKLMTFIDNKEKFNKLDKEDQDDLVYQANAMIAYISILKKRLGKLIINHSSEGNIKVG